MAVRKSPLRVVEADEVAVGPPESLSEAVESGDYVRILVAQRREIALSIPDEKGPAKAALHRQLSLIAKELESIAARDRGEAGGVSQVQDGEFDAASI